MSVYRYQGVYRQPHQFYPLSNIVAGTGPWALGVTPGLRIQVQVDSGLVMSASVGGEDDLSSVSVSQSSPLLVRTDMSSVSTAPGSVVTITADPLRMWAQVTGVTMSGYVGQQPPLIMEMMVSGEPTYLILRSSIGPPELLSAKVTGATDVMLWKVEEDVPGLS